MVRLTDRPNMTLDVYGGRKTITQQQHKGQILRLFVFAFPSIFSVLFKGMNFSVAERILSFKSLPSSGGVEAAEGAGAER